MRLAPCCIVGRRRIASNVRGDGMLRTRWIMAFRFRLRVLVGRFLDWCVDAALLHAIGPASACAEVGFLVLQVPS